MFKQKFFFHFSSRAEAELQALHKEVSKKVSNLQLTFSVQETEYKVRLKSRRCWGSSGFTFRNYALPHQNPSSE